MLVNVFHLLCRFKLSKYHLWLAWLVKQWNITNLFYAMWFVYHLISCELFDGNHMSTEKLTKWNIVSFITRQYEWMNDLFSKWNETSLPEAWKCTYNEVNNR